MGVISGDPYFLACDELSGGRTGVPWSMDGQRDYTRRFRVRVKVKEMSSVSVVLCPGLPLPASFYISGTGIEYDTAALLVKMKAEQDKDEAAWEHWTVTCDYSTKLPPGGAPSVPGRANSSQGAQNNPDLEPPDIEWDFETIQYALERDHLHKPFLNSAHQPFSPAPTFDLSYPVLNMSRNEMSFKLARANFYNGALNKKTFLGMPPETVQCMAPKAKLSNRGKIAYWRVTYKLRFSPIVPNPNWNPGGDPMDPDTNAEFMYRDWQPEVLDKGMYEIDKREKSPTKGKPIPIFRNHQPVTHPVLLNGAGSEAKPNPTTGIISPFYIPFTIYPVADLNDLIVSGLG